ncbi:MAG: hypothetical protein N2035_08915 [Chthoniobacterales bacterium]|nr:hypothetical protein [Chthoniobacterales bacterium]
MQASNDLTDWSTQTNITSSLTPGQTYNFVDSADLALPLAASKGRAFLSHEAQAT